MAFFGDGQPQAVANQLELGTSIYIDGETSIQMTSNQTMNDDHETGQTQGTFGTSVYGGAVSQEKTTETKQQVKKLRKRLKNYVKEHGNKQLEKDENIMNLEEGVIFGVKSPAIEIMNE